MSFKYLSEAVHWLTVHRFPEYLTTAEPLKWESCSREISMFIVKGEHNLSCAEQVNITDILNCGEAKHLNMFHLITEIK